MQNNISLMTFSDIIVIILLFGQKQIQKMQKTTFYNPT